MADGKPQRIADLLKHCYPRIASYRRWHQTAVQRGARKFAVVVGQDAKGNLLGSESTELMARIKGDSVG